MPNFSVASMPPPLALIATFAFLAGTALTPAVAQQPLSLKDSVPNISTEGTASIEVVPDIATILIGADTERPKAADAARENTWIAQAIVGEIKAQGIEDKDIKTVFVTLEPVYDEVRDSTGRITKRTLRGFTAHNSLRVRVRDIKKAGALASQLI